MAEIAAIISEGIAFNTQAVSQAVISSPRNFAAANNPPALPTPAGLSLENIDPSLLIAGAIAIVALFAIIQRGQS